MMLIFSAFGATANYPDQETMRKTLSAFLDSVIGQTDQEFRLFLIGHDKPEFAPNDVVLWHSLFCDQDHDATLVPEELPKRILDPIKYRPMPGKGKMQDMSWKVEHGTIQAALWAHKNGIRDFWMMRMDSDDLLAIDTVLKIHALGNMGIRAVFNRTCHMFDIKTKQIAIHKRPYSNTPNALKFRINDDGTLTPDWFYLCMNHTLFHGRVQRDKIPYMELDFTYCIVTNTGNSISGRPTLNEVEQTEEIHLTKELIERYGIERLL
jgi:hypothetical protein